MNENSMHSSLGAFIETLRKMRKITIAELTLEAHISTKTYIHIKKGSMQDGKSSVSCPLKPSDSAPLC